MFAVIRTGGKQYKVAKDDIITVEKLLGEPGEKIQLGDVLMLGEEGKAPTVGTPLVQKAAVTAEIVEQGKGDKVIVFKKKRRHNYRRTKGHRQEQTILKVLEVSATGAKATAKKVAASKADDAGDATKHFEVGARNGAALRFDSSGGHIDELGESACRVRFYMGRRICSRRYHWRNHRRDDHRVSSCCLFQ